MADDQRLVTVAPARLARFVNRFVERHGPCSSASDGDAVRLTAADGAIAAITVPFPPLPRSDDPLEALLAHAQRDRVVGALLVRKGGFAVGVFAGRTLLASKVGSSYVQGRTKAGGWSQQRFARRRANQSRQLVDEAIKTTVGVLVPRFDELEALVTGGDRTAVQQVLTDPRLADVRGLVRGRTMPVPDPRLRVLQEFPDRFLAVEIRLNDLA